MLMKRIKPIREFKTEADELIKQIGDVADSPEEIPSALDGFNFTSQTAKGEVPTVRGRKSQNNSDFEIFIDLRAANLDVNLRK